jgi:hypothetical protein
MSTEASPGRYALSRYPADAWLERFRSRRPRLQPRSPERRSGEPVAAWSGPQVAMVDLEFGEIGIELVMDASGGRVDPRALQRTEALLLQLVAMDTAARQCEPPALDHQEMLDVIEVPAEGPVHFHYTATAVDTEWRVRFLLTEAGGFTVLGIG